MPDPNEPNAPAVVEPPIVVQEPPTTPGFHDDLEPDLKASPSILKFKDKNTLARSYVNLEKELGKRVGLPDFEKGDQKDVDAFWGKLGVPNAPEGYKLVPPKFPDGSGLEFAKEDLDSFSKLAHEARLDVGVARTGPHPPREQAGENVAPDRPPSGEDSFGNYCALHVVLHDGYALRRCAGRKSVRGAYRGFSIRNLRSSKHVLTSASATWIRYTTVLIPGEMRTSSAGSPA